jgi:S-adenosyl-L-methionine hydrolase (adenosine-forming)
MTRVVTFLSDYGAGDEFVGVVHAVIARICLDARVIDLGHGVPPQDVRTGARRLARALPYAPSGVHLAVVDPGVGGPRRAVALRTRREERLLVGPDNGLLVDAAERFGGVEEAVEISDSPWRLEPVSATFHGRDIFAPVAAELALGEPLADGGEPLDPSTLVRLEPLVPRADGDALVAHVAEVDGFGNLVLDALPADFYPASLTSVRAAGRPVVVGRTFGDAEPGDLVLYADAGGALALAVNGGSAASALRLSTGDEVRLES